MPRTTIILACLLLIAASLLHASDFELKNSTPVLHVDAIEPSVAFWTGTLGFTVAMELEEEFEGGKRLGFVALKRDDVEVMFQTVAGVEKERPELAADLEGDATLLYMEVDSIDLIINALEEADIVVPKHDTFYGATEIGIREPGGHYVVFAEFPQETKAGEKTENTLRLGPGEVQPEASIEEVAWIAGSWAGEAFGGATEEVWAAPSAGTMAGTFKLMHEGEVSLYEFIMIVEENESLVMKLKHFNDDFSGWESKKGFVSFPLVKLDENGAYFDGLTYRRDGDDRMTVYLVVSTKDGVREEVFPYRRVGK